MNKHAVGFGCAATLALASWCQSFLNAQALPTSESLPKPQAPAAKDATIPGMEDAANLVVLPKPSRRTETHIFLSKCRVQLIDDVTLACTQSGVLDFVAQEGDVVKKDQVVAHTKDDLVKATLRVMEKQASNDAEIRFASLDHDLQQVKYERDLQINKVVPDTVPDIDIREHRLAVQKALLSQEQAEINLEIEKLRRDETRERLQLHSVKAPFAGVVRRVHKKTGEAVGEGEPIVEIVNTQRVHVEGYVHIGDLDDIAVGSAVFVRLEIPGVDLEIEKQSFAGRINHVDVKVEPVSHLVKVRAVVENRDSILKEGLTAEMAINR